MNATTLHKNEYSFGLLGFPLDHSLSPVLHHTALKCHNLKGKYHLFPVDQNDFHLSIPQQLIRIRSGELDGLNVTIPYKQKVIQYLDELTPAADAIGAVNTIYVDNNKLFGHNTDAGGFKRDLESLNIDHQAGNILVLGAGGAARAVVYSLLRSDSRVIICARRTEQANQIKLDFESKVLTNHLHIIELSEESLTSNLNEVFLIINTTPLGMSPNTNRCPWPENLIFPPDACLYDLIYNPLKTKLMQIATISGARAYNGLGMLIEQAAMAFFTWTGLDPDKDKMREAALNALA